MDILARLRRAAGMHEEADSHPQGKQNHWERETLIQLATASLKEQRRARRWGIFFKLLTFAYLVALLIMLGDFDFEETVKNEKHSALVELKGVIFAGAEASAENVMTGLRKAFKDESTKGVILRINSPGGSPVQAGYINDEIRRLRKKYPDIPLYAVIADIAASGGYYVAVAADKVYANKASLIGSIGVRMDSFGFVDAIDKLGIERRLLTAGADKGLLDPFLPLKQNEKEHVQTLLNDIHAQFIAAVKQGRGDRLNGTPKIYSGLIWTGEESLELGLVDGLASAGDVARDVIGAEDIVDFTKKREWFERFTDRFGTAIANTFTTHVLQPNLR
jgi:protease-4